MWKILFFIIFIFYSVFGWKVTKVSTPDVKYSHSPYYDVKTNCLYFVNFTTTGNELSIFRYRFADNVFDSVYIDGLVSPAFIVPINKHNKKCKPSDKACEDQYFAVGADDIHIVKWNGESPKAEVVGTAIVVDRDRANVRLDPWIPDGKGRFYGGTLSYRFCNSTPTQSLYRYTVETGLTRLVDGLQSFTGIVFNEAICKMYFLDTCQCHIVEYDYDPETGDICNGRVIYKFPLDGIPINTRFPIGLAIDTEGMIYFAVYTGRKDPNTSEIWKIDPSTQAVLEVITIPAPGAAGCVFCGPNLDKLCVVIESTIFDLILLQNVREFNVGASIYIVSEINAKGLPPARLNIKHSMTHLQFGTI